MAAPDSFMAVPIYMFVEAQAEARDPKPPGALSFSFLFSQMSPDAFEGAQLMRDLAPKIETDTLNP